MIRLYHDDDVQRGVDSLLHESEEDPFWHRRVRAVLDAVAPAIAARALREAAEAIAPATTTGRYPEESAVLHERESIAESLCDRADEIEGAS